MKTSEQIYTDWFGSTSHTTRRSPSKANVIAAMEEYRNQQPQPRPIEELFELKEYSEVWVKYKKSGNIIYGLFTPIEVTDVLSYLDIPCYHECLTKDKIIEYFESFIIAEIPKF